MEVDFFCPPVYRGKMKKRAGKIRTSYIVLHCPSSNSEEKFKKIKIKKIYLL